MTEPTGRRERKKAQTRRSLADAALRLFMERGFDQVGVKDVADEADVSVTTLFKHFPSKEALLFDEADDIEAGLVAAVRNRPPDQSIPHALKNHLTRVDSHNNDPRFADFLKLVDTTPALRDYAHRMWMRHETALAAAIAAETGAPPDDIRSTALAHFALEAKTLADNHPDPTSAMDAIFTLLAKGWEATET
ncbi:TetR/AcrR family transcriptional regulator [Kibdelosporangium lantanae]|uniref:TetR/AcrR family transcriptional regulator n=1 Tax=Kibdelosporangium lantanae TaxID=1497396 RepID=A0ABW3M453_9PSEU